MFNKCGLSVVPVQSSHSAVQLEALKQQLTEATANAALFEGSFQEERALRRQVSAVLSCKSTSIV